MQIRSAIYSTSILYFLLRFAAADELSNIEARQRKEDLSFCFSEDSICPQASKLYDECKDLQNNFNDLNPWYECVCGNGYTATNRACNWCRAAYNLTRSVGIVEDQIETCESLSYSLAPIPTQIIAVQSSFNATYTGMLLTAGDNSSPSTTPVTNSASSSETGSSTASGTATAIASSRKSATTASAIISTVTLNGGGAGAGGARSSTTSGAQQQSATSSPSAIPTGAAPGNEVGLAFILSVIISASLALLLV